MKTRLSLERIDEVKSVALKKILTEQLKAQQANGEMKAYGKHKNYSDHGNCLCLIGGV